MSASMPENTEKDELLKRASSAIKDLRSKIASIDQDRHEPIAIVGMSCRFPGGANTPDEFWSLLRSGKDAITEIPAERWDINRFYDEHVDTPGKMNTRYGGFLSDIDLFDASFFEISPREANSLDPQHRILLEMSWQALENACQEWEQLAGSRTGVFISVGTADYAKLLQGDNELERLDSYASTGNATSTAAGRISYTLGFQGPSMVVDTACSSSLSALHLACQSLRLRECDAALAGGINLILVPDISVALSKTHMLAPDGRCKTFDAQANGFGRGEGCGLVVLKRLSDALESRDPILALIRGSSINQDGRSNGLTAPNGRAQEAVIREALQAARIEGEKIGYVEAHGTGTSLGDPIEIRALSKVLGNGRQQQVPLYVGSVKTNLGHLEAAAGVAGLIKTILVLQHAEIPPHLHLQTPNPYIAWNDLPLAIPTRLTSWEAQSGQSRYAGISAFGASGTNAHVILEEAPPGIAVQDTSPTIGERAYLLPLSGRSPQALQALVEHYITWLQEHAHISLESICYTASTRRCHHEYRLAVIGQTHEELVVQLRAFQQNQREQKGAAGRYEPGSTPHKVAFIFSGQGGQYVGMGRELLEQESVFRASLEMCDRLLQKYVSWSLLEELQAPAAISRLHQTQIAQPLLFALQVGMVALWRSWGVKPEAVVGHSVGEIAAAYVAGVLGLEEALLLATLRGEIMQDAENQGEMAIVELPVAEVETLLQAYQDQLVIAGMNSPTTTLLSGNRRALEEVMLSLRPRQIFSRLLDVKYAFHSPQMERFLLPFAERLQTECNLQAQEPYLPFYSTVTGTRLRKQVLDAAYWVRNVREPVNFAAATEQLLRDGSTCLIEIGPQPVLRHALLQTVLYTEQNGMLTDTHPRSTEISILSSLQHQVPDRRALLQTVATLYTQGIPLKWSEFYPARQLPTLLPTYPFQRSRFWAEVRSTPDKTPHRQRLSSSELLSDDAVERLLFELRWRSRGPILEQVSAIYPSNEPAGIWILYADQQGIASALQHILQQRGERVVWVTPGAMFARLHHDAFIIRPTSVQDSTRLLSEVFSKEQFVCRGVLHLWGLDLKERTEHQLNGNMDYDPASMLYAQGTLQQAQERGCESAIALIQALARQNWDATLIPRLWLITCGAQQVDETCDVIDEAGLLQTPLWGLGRVLAVEHSELWGGLIDLNPAASALTNAQHLHTQLYLPIPTKQVVLRQGQAYQAYLEHTRSTNAPAHLIWRTDGAYLITGGLGALGRTVASWAVSGGARRLIILSRTALPSRARWRDIQTGDPLYEHLAFIKKLEAQGAHIEVESVDVADMAQLRAFFQAYTLEERPPLRGIFHLAGVLEDRLLIQSDHQAFELVWRPKVVGGWNLHTLLRTQPLDFFVVFSALGALFGSQGLASYAAANAFLDGLAQYRSGLQLPGLSLNWGPWEGSGFASTAGAHFVAEQLQQRGVHLLPTTHALQALEHALRGPSQQVGIADVDWQHFLHGENSLPYSTFGFLGDKAGGDQVRTASEVNEMHVTFKKLLPAQRSEYIEDLVRDVVGQVLHLDSLQLDVHQPLGTLGLNSLMSLEIKTYLEQRTKLVLSSTLTWNYPTIVALASHLAEKMDAVDHPSLNESVEMLSSKVTESLKSSSDGLDFEDLSEAEAEKRLAAKLAAFDDLA